MSISQERNPQTIEEFNEVKRINLNISLLCYNLPNKQKVFEVSKISHWNWYCYVIVQNFDN